jgi:hypothetical protein
VRGFFLPAVHIRADRGDNNAKGDSLTQQEMDAAMYAVDQRAVDEVRSLKRCLHGTTTAIPWLYGMGAGWIETELAHGERDKFERRATNARSLPPRTEMMQSWPTLSIS